MYFTGALDQLAGCNYDVVYADPPWHYNDKALAGSRGAGCKYHVMSIEDIARLPVSSIASSDSVLFLWVTMPQLLVGLRVIEAWGFTFKTAGFTWVKRNKKGAGWFWGMGNWTRANAELCLLATRGKPRRVSAGVHSVLDSPIEGHSRKPDEARQRIKQLMGTNVACIELFARGEQDGWDQWGDEEYWSEGVGS